MANKQRGEVSFKIGKTRYLLRLTTNAVCELQDFSAAQNKNGVERTWDQVLAGIDRGSMKDVRFFFWVAFRDRHPEIATDDPASLKAIGTIIDQAGGAQSVVKVISALLAANADVKDEDEPAEGPKTERPQDAQVGTGDGSMPTH